MNTDEHLELIGARAFAKYRLQLEKSVPEPRPLPRAPELLPKPTVITTRKYAAWRLRIAGVRR